MVKCGTLRQALTAAWQKISDRNHWVQGMSARDIRGDQVRATDTNAVAWCAIGAFELVVDDDGLFDRGLEILCQASRDVANCDDPALVNDTLGHEAIMQVYRRALALLAIQEEQGTEPGFSAEPRNSIPRASVVERRRRPAMFA